MNSTGVATAVTGPGVRVLADGDWGAVSALEAAVYAPLGLSEGERRLRSRARPSPGTCLVVESGGALAGYLLALPCPAFSAPDLARPEPSGADGLARPGSPEADGAEVSSRNLHLHDLVIVPELRRRGLARNALERLIRTARTQGYERLSLVAVGGSDAFWSSCGFAAHPSVPVPDSYGRSAVYMSLPLTAGPPSPGADGVFDPNGDRQAGSSGVVMAPNLRRRVRRRKDVYMFHAEAAAAPASPPPSPSASSSPSPSPSAIDAHLAERLLVEQFPQWADLPLALLDPAGSDHVIFRLGDDMAVRLPRGDWAAGQAEKEHRWLPRLAPGLPLAVPVPLGLGTPSPELGYPWHWSVSRWLDGAVPEVGATERSESARSLSIARQLADFLTALHRLAPAGTFLPGPHIDLVGESLASRDDDTRAAIAATADVFDADAMTSAWNAALGAPPWSGGPRWFHGDFHTGNLLADPDGRLCAVIDFGGLGMGDPACDLTIAYTFLGASGRAAFRTLLATDDGTWARGLGWALCTGLNAYTTYAATHPRVAAQTTRQILQALAEHQR